MPVGTFIFVVMLEVASLGMSVSAVIPEVTPIGVPVFTFTVATKVAAIRAQIVAIASEVMSVAANIPTVAEGVSVVAPPKIVAQVTTFGAKVSPVIIPVSVPAKIAQILAAVKSVALKSGVAEIATVVARVPPVIFSVAAKIALPTAAVKCAVPPFAPV